MTLSKSLYQLLSTGSIQEDPSGHDRKIVDWNVKNQNKTNCATQTSNKYTPDRQQSKMLILQ